MTLVTCLLESSKKMVPNKRVEVVLTEAMDVSNKLRINGDISGAMEKHLGGGIVALIGIEDYLFYGIVSECVKFSN
ncbi:hypothetical protein TorRG33x02_291950 [Trema orientale]|uniref:Uncharacterized protein n=1 Tax=Trema orientale TaxID=63057 RepID=A0A2P5CAH5_TREOI|nr:hypothetical protein TorRG33x02_291950 [Trema orientale]